MRLTPLESCHSRQSASEMTHLVHYKEAECSILLQVYIYLLESHTDMFTSTFALLVLCLRLLSANSATSTSSLIRLQPSQIPRIPPPGPRDGMVNVRDTCHEDPIRQTLKDLDIHRRKFHRHMHTQQHERY